MRKRTVTLHAIVVLHGVFAVQCAAAILLYLAGWFAGSLDADSGSFLKSLLLHPIVYLALAGGCGIPRAQYHFAAGVIKGSFALYFMVYTILPRVRAMFTEGMAEGGEGGAAAEAELEGGAEPLEEEATEGN